MIISVYIFTVAFFLITSDFSIHLMHFTSELQTPITFLFVNEHIKCGYAPGEGGYSYFILIHRLGPSIFRSPPTNMSGISSTQKNEIVQTPKIIPDSVP